MTALTAQPDLGLATPEQALRLVRGAGVVALDCETTGLDPRRHKLRLLSLADGKRSAVLDAFRHPNAVRPLLDALRGKILVAHNAAFDLGFLWHAGLTEPPETVCTMLLAQLVSAGTGYSCSLAACCEYYLHRELPKEMQTSDWSGPLTPEQVAYARTDAEVLIPLYRELARRINTEGLTRVSDLELRALPAFVWMAQTGVAFDRAAWEALARKAAAAKARLENELDEQSPRKGAAGLFGAVESWNWSSWQQVQEVFTQLGHQLGVEFKGQFHATTNDAALALCGHPLADVLRDHRHQAQLVKMYGANWLDAATIVDGRLYPGWMQIGTVTGRTSAKKPNVQQIPRDEDGAGRIVYKTCFPAPPGRVLVKADYAALQMRIACKWAEDSALADVFADNGDPHSATARALLGKDNASKGERQIAKSANFCLLFGGSAEALRIYAKTTYGLTLSSAESKRHRDAFFRAYAGLARWHERTRRDHVKETRCTSGRRRLMHSTDPDTERLNSPVQGDEADGLKLALALLWERRAKCPGAVPVLAVHDEIVVECATEQTQVCKAWLTEAMTDGMRPWLDPVPVKVDAKVTQTWG